MKFSAVTVACLATGVYSAIAEPPTRVYERDIATITGAINSVGQGIDGLDSAVNKFAGNPKDVQNSADKLITTLKDSKSKVEGSGKLTLADALGLQEPVKGLQQKSEVLVKDLKDRKAQVKKGGFCVLVREKLGSINSGSLSLIKAVVEKVPTEAQDIAENLASGLKKVLEEARTEFNEENCKDSDGGAKPSSPASSAQPSIPASEVPSEPASTATVPATSAAPQPSSPSTKEPLYPTASGPAEPPTQPTGTGVPPVATTTQVPVVTAGAAMLAPAGALAVVMAAAML